MELSLLDQAHGTSPGPKPSAVNIVDISKRYAGRRRSGSIRSFLFGVPWEVVALDGVNFSVEHGEVFGLLGPNGSGKTTLIKILSNLVTPDSGSVYVEGINVVKRPYAAASRLQTVLSESIGLEKRITVRQNLALFASLYSLPKSEANEKIDRLLDLFGLSEVGDKVSQSLSTGMSRKLSVCRVLLSHASVVVFDEPTAGLDPLSAENFRHLILEDLVRREKKTVIMATHNLSEATSICSRIALLNRGRIMAVGTPEAVRRSVQDRVDLTLTVEGASGTLVEIRRELMTVEGVNSVDVRETGSVSRIQLWGRKDLDYLGLLSKIYGRGLKVLSLETSSPSLEDAFLRLTREAEK